MKNRYRHLDMLLDRYNVRRDAIARRLKDFSAVPPAQYFYELCYCLMTPQSSAVNAAQAQQILENSRFHGNEIDPEPILRNPSRYIRFHKTKAAWLQEMKKNYPAIESMLMENLPAVVRREWLVKHVMGLSLKEATHFLRNIGKNGTLAILDRHIMKNLVRHGIIRSIPKTLTAKRYRAVEKKFQHFADSLRIDINELDLLFWSGEAGAILK